MLFHATVLLLLLYKLLFLIQYQLLIDIYDHMMICINFRACVRKLVTLTFHVPFGSAFHVAGKTFRVPSHELTTMYLIQQALVRSSTHLTARIGLQRAIVPYYASCLLKLLAQRLLELII